MVNLSFSLVTFEYFLMIVVRVASFVAVAPFYGTNNTPRRVKIGFSVMVAILLFQILERPALDYEGVFGFAVIIIREGITGLLIGFAASVCNSIILLAGNMIDMEIGLSMATEYDPMNNTQVNITGQLYNYLLLLLLIATDMHHYILRAVVDSYKLIPVNGQVFQWDHLFQSFLTYMTDLFVIAFRIILPIFCSYDDTELHFGNYGKSCTADEHVCHRYADEDPDRIFNYVFDHSAFTKHFKLCV